jgi:CelD/BcsL family acetyltransferase involved in cellulose biosynthesis
LNKRLKRLEKEYAVGFKTQHDFSSIKDAINIFFDLHDKRWNSKEGRSSFFYKPNRDFHLELATTLNENNWLSLYFLTVDDEPIAAIYSFDYGLKKYGYNTGFDPKFAKYGIGNMLKNFAITESIKKGLTEYDLLRGYEPYKKHWVTGVRKNFVALLPNNSWRGSLFLRINKFKQQFKSKY